MKNPSTIHLMYDRAQGVVSRVDELTENPANFTGFMVGFGGGIIAGMVVLENKSISNLKAEYGPTDWQAVYETKPMADSLSTKELIGIGGGFPLAATALCIAGVHGMRRLAASRGFRI